jgi:hypothetical protein
MKCSILLRWEFFEVVFYFVLIVLEGLGWFQDFVPGHEETGKLPRPHVQFG